MKTAHLEGMCTKCRSYMTKTIEFESYRKLDEQKRAIHCPRCKIPINMLIMEIEETEE